MNFHTVMFSRSEEDQKVGQLYLTEVGLHDMSLNSSNHGEFTNGIE